MSKLLGKMKAKFGSNDSDIPLSNASPSNSIVQPAPTHQEPLWQQHQNPQIRGFYSPDHTSVISSLASQQLTPEAEYWEEHRQPMPVGSERPYAWAHGALPPKQNVIPRRDLPAQQYQTAAPILQPSFPSTSRNIENENMNQGLRMSDQNAYILGIQKRSDMAKAAATTAYTGTPVRLEQIEKQDRKSEQQNDCLVDTIRNMRDLIREKYRLDLYVWNERGCQVADREDIEPEAHKADCLLKRIHGIIEHWEKDMFDDEEWKIAEKIKKGLNKHPDRKLLWDNIPPWDARRKGKEYLNAQSDHFQDA